MATNVGKKRTTTRSRTAKPGASKAPAKRRVSGTAATPKKRLVFSGKAYTQAGCAKTKTAAKSLAAGKRKQGKLARVVSSGAGYCVYTRG
jgi:hypothetical protein